MVTDARSWKKDKEEKDFELKVPSGHTCLVRRPGPEIFVRQGMIPNSLMAIIMPLLDDAKAEGAKGDVSPIPDSALAEMQNELVNDPSKFADMVTMVDNITLACVIAPPLAPTSRRAEIQMDSALTTDEKEELTQNTLFIDDVDFEDKMFIFQYVVGGTADLERFRLGTEQVVAAGPLSAEVSLPTE